MLHDLLDRRFVLVTGKGGVGKSTVTALLARICVAQGHRTLVCELNTRERIPELFGHAPVGAVVTQIADGPSDRGGLWSVNIKPEVAMEEYALMKLRFKTLYRLVFDNPLVQSAIRLVPGVNHLTMMGKAFNHEREMNGDTPAWDRIIIDAPATGHGLTFFQLPKIIRDAVPAGNLHQEADDMWSLLTDPKRTAVHLVCLPEELPVQETLEFHDKLSALGLPLGALFVNMVPPPLLTDAQRAEFATLTTEPSDPALADIWRTARVRLSREGLAAQQLERLADLSMTQVRLPTIYTDTFDETAIAALADATCEQLDCERAKWR
ncbi:MAG: anion-transporting ArsA/GET3 family ATPase [Bradymonadia bacterium]|jgi:anion-transporting  ArsA/GET3 family ATPase